MTRAQQHCLSGTHPACSASRLVGAERAYYISETDDCSFCIMLFTQLCATELHAHRRPMPCLIRRPHLESCPLPMHDCKVSTLTVQIANRRAEFALPINEAEWTIAHSAFLYILSVRLLTCLATGAFATVRIQPGPRVPFTHKPSIYLTAKLCPLQARPAHHSGAACATYARRTLGP